MRIEVGISFFLLRTSQLYIDQTRYYLTHHLTIHVQFENKADLKKEKFRKTKKNKGIKMLCNCIPKSDYDKLYEVNGNDLQCENENCTNCLVEELKKQKWHNRKFTNDHEFLKIAHEKNIIQVLPSSIEELNKEDKKRIKTILALCHLEEYYLW